MWLTRAQHLTKILWLTCTKHFTTYVAEFAIGIVQIQVTNLTLSTLQIRLTDVALSNNNWVHLKLFVWAWCLVIVFYHSLFELGFSGVILQLFIWARFSAGYSLYLFFSSNFISSSISLCWLVFIQLGPSLYETVFLSVLLMIFRYVLSLWICMDFLWKSLLSSTSYYS